MTLEISRRGKEYLKTAQTLLQAAHKMTDQAIAGQLKALADDYQRRAEKASHVDAAKALGRPAASAEAEWSTSSDARFHRYPAEETSHDVAPVTSFSLPFAEFQGPR